MLLSPLRFQYLEANGMEQWMHCLNQSFSIILAKREACIAWEYVSLSRSIRLNSIFRTQFSELKVGNHDHGSLGGGASTSFLWGQALVAVEYHLGHLIPNNSIMTMTR